jgi:putative hemolysin
MDPDALALPLSFLHHHARSEGPWSATAHAERFVGMDRLPAEMVDAKLALKQMPPLIKGYLRIGARFGTGAVIDRRFGTTDVLVVLPVAAIDKRYTDYYGGETPRRAA